MLRRSLGGFPHLLTHQVPRLAGGVAREAAWTTAHLMMYPLGLLAEPVRRTVGRHDLGGLSPQQRGLVHAGVDAAARPILLVHGIVDNHSIFAVMDRALRRRGFTDLSSFDYGLLTSDIRRAAADLEVAVSALVSRSGYDRIHVIGHSLGGLIARYYVQRLGGHPQVQTLVTLGTPHQGTELARAGRILPLVRQLTPQSDVIRELAEPAPECSTRFVAFYSDLDQLVRPSRNGRIDHPDLDTRNVAVSGLGHLSLPNSGAIAFQIAEVLQQLDPDEVAPA
ncbi:MAG: alpha/beta fold hydrolase [Propionibacteriaceae bacterium]